MKDFISALQLSYVYLHGLRFEFVSLDEATGIAVIENPKTRIRQHAHVNELKVR
jgi:hypothetical protein